MQLSCERVSEALLLAGRDLHAVSLSGQVPDDDRWVRSTGSINWCAERASNDQDGHGFGLLVGNVKDSLRGTAINELYAKDLSLREGGGDRDIDGSGLKLCRVIDLFFELLDLGNGLLAEFCCTSWH